MSGSGRDRGPRPDGRVSHQVVVGEAGDLLLDAVLDFGLRRQRRRVVQHLLLLLDVVPEQLDLSVKGFQLIFVVLGLGLQLSLQQSERTGITMTTRSDI